LRLVAGSNAEACYRKVDNSNNIPAGTAVRQKSHRYICNRNTVFNQQFLKVFCGFLFRGDHSVFGGVAVGELEFKNGSPFVWCETFAGLFGYMRNFIVFSRTRQMCLCITDETERAG